LERRVTVGFFGVLGEATAGDISDVSGGEVGDFSCPEAGTA
jgi:hypothetical protein